MTPKKRNTHETKKKKTLRRIEKKTDERRKKKKELRTKAIRIRVPCVRMHVFLSFVSRIQ